MDKLIHLNNTNNSNYNLANNCEILISEYLKISIMYTKINKTNCVTNSCKRRKEELIGCLKNLHDSIEICK